MNASVQYNRPHPAILVAAACVSAFALAGIGVLTGAIPSSHGTPAPLITHSETAASAAAPSVPTTEPTTAKTAKPVQRETRKTETTQRTAAKPATAATNAVPPAPAAAVCRDCGVIESVREIAHDGDASGVGAVAGGVLGAVLGNQVGAGRGKSAATVLGGIGGAVAGHQIEKSQKKKFSYEIVVRFDDGTSRVLTQDTPPNWRQGDRVRVADGVIATAG